MSNAPEDDWPPEELEAVAACPVCGGMARDLLYAGLRDRVFFCAPGAWSLFRCRTCGSGHLDPRPSESDMGRAYASYYTHGGVTAGGGARASAGRAWSLALGHGYLNARYGYAFRPALPWGRLLLSPRSRGRADRRVRSLRLPTGRRRLLDLGCGNGAWLARMGDWGWSAVGLDPDPRAVGAARSAGLTVHEGRLTAGAFPAGSFDAITMSHVLEHLHDPVGTLRVCHDILAPEGAIWIATPNLDAWGHRRFGGNWRGLEPPRHLVLFTPDALMGALERLGFRVEAGPLPCWNARWFFEVSTEIARGQVPSDAPALPSGLRRAVRRQAQWANLRAWRRPALGEEIILLARKRPELGSVS